MTSTGEPQTYSLCDIFASGINHDDELNALVEDAIYRLSNNPRLINQNPGGMAVIDLQGKAYVLSKPLEIKKLNLVTVANGTLIAGPQFPENEYLIQCQRVHGVKFYNLLLECSKRANGFFFDDFFRVRVEDCYVIHQKNYGIYSSPTGNNHELEIMKCHVCEYLFGDGYPKKTVNYGVIPEYDVDANRVSTGIYLGQADNVVADCNINLCRVGIFSGMRANRIHGNHITGGGSKELEIYKGIELNNFHKSSAMIVNNYIDNCCLWINCNADDKKNLRNYFHVTDNLFYRGYNHPKAGGEFSHIIINPLEPDSLIANLHICDNKFYNQPENLEGIKPRVIKPIQILKSEGTNINHGKIQGVNASSNYFTNCYPTFVVPMGTRASKKVKVTPEKNNYNIDFSDIIPMGIIRECSIDIEQIKGNKRCSTQAQISFRSIQLEAHVDYPVLVVVSVCAECNNLQRYNYSVH